jgi:hypothetical protein
MQLAVGLDKSLLAGPLDDRNSTSRFDARLPYEIEYTNSYNTGAGGFITTQEKVKTAVYSPGINRTLLLVEVGALFASAMLLPLVSSIAKKTEPLRAKRRRRRYYTHST